MDLVRLLYAYKWPIMEQREDVCIEVMMQPNRMETMPSYHI